MERNIYLNKLPLTEAQSKFFEFFGELLMSGEVIPVSEARGRVTASPVYAQRSAPHYYAAAMDGIAVRAVETIGASERRPVRLQEGEQAIRVDTGDPVPEGFNAVIKIEEINEEDGWFIIEKAVSPWQHVRGIGESVIKGQLILPCNHKITPYDLGALLEGGITQLQVRKRPRVGIMPTGSELITPEQEPEKGQLIEFNSSMIKASAEEWGATASVTRIVRDDYQQIKEQFRQLLSESDLAVILAGSSAGEEDYTVSVLAELGKIIVHGVNIMPGKPVILAEVEGKPVIGLPGYPLAALLNFNLFARPLLYQLSGLDAPEIPAVEAVVKRKVPSGVGLLEFLRVNLARIDDQLITVPRKRGSAAMESLLKADGLLAVPEQQEGLEAGSRCRVYLLKPEQEIYNNLLMIGSHDLTLDLLVDSLYEQRSGFDLSLQSAGSMAGLMSLKRGECHLAGAHLLDQQSGDYNRSFVERIFPGREMALITLVHREQGLMVQPGNPLHLQTIEDLTADGVVYINRQRGAGTRVLLDYFLQQAGIETSRINGYDREQYTHIGAAVAVASGSADAALGIKAATRAMDLDFIPLAEERYDLILPLEMLTDWRIERLVSIIKSASFQAAVRELEGYRTDSSGEIIKLGKD